ncbi:glycosyltransferase family 4 protein [Brevundimonas sp. TWP1-2-1b1]|uniref:glycosyltransferase family 4 protein n=1 Tax=unclassified Brevundimonas TaxID=2622653 RepID=UPI003CE8E862
MTTVCIDGFNLALQQGSGIATYARNLLIDLNAIGYETQVLYGPKGKRGNDDALNEAILVDSERSGKPPKRASRYLRTMAATVGVSAHFIPRTGRVIWPDDGAAQPPAASFWSSRDLFRTSHRAFQRFGTTSRLHFTGAPKPDIVHWTTPLPLHAAGSVNVCTIHDLIPLRLPHSTSEDKKNFYDLFKKSAATSDHIITVSETTRNDVISSFGVPEDKVTNVYQSISIPKNALALSDLDVSTHLFDVFGLKWKDYFIHYGNIEPKKNLGRIFEAFSQAETRRTLVIVGGKGWLRENEISLMQQVIALESPLSKRVIYLEYLPLITLVGLVRGARATLFPSLYEGFGLPIVESMVLGTAVMTSNLGAPKEIAGSAAALVDPFSVASIKLGIEALDRDDDLLRTLEHHGRKRALHFSPERTQARIKEVYRRLHH